MQLKQLLNDDDAVSPVIGVILMVAITVILAAVIGTFVLGLGDQVQETAPNAQYDWDYDSTTGELEVSHEGGETLSQDTITIRTGLSAGFASADVSSGPIQLDGSGNIEYTQDINAGTTGVIIADGSAGNDHTGQTLRVVWESSSGDSSSTISEYEVPT